MYPRYCPSAGVVLSLERDVPCQRFGGGACHTGYAGNAPGCAFTGEMLFEDGAIIVLFLVLRGMYWEAFGGMCHLFVADGSGSDGFQRINPTVAHTVGELFFLPPGNVLREHVGKGFADYFLFYLLAGAHLDCRIDAHGNIQEFFVEEGDTSFHSPGCKAFVGTEAVVQMQFGELAHGFFVKGLRCGRLVEVKVTAEHLVRTFAAEYHLDAHAFDDTCQQIHGGGGADSGYVVSLNEIDDVADSIEAFLNGIVYLVMHGTDMTGHFASFNQVGSTLQADGEGMELRPPGICLVVCLDAFGGIFLGDGRDDGRIESATEQDTVGDVGHQLALYGGFKCVVHSRDLCAVGCPAYRSRRGITFGGRSVVVLHSGIVHPVAGVPAVHLALAPTVVVAGKERLVLVAETLKGFQLTAEVDVSILVASYIKGYHADGVAGDEVIVRLFVIEGKGEDAVQFFEEADAFVFVKGKDDFAVGTGLEGVFSGIAGTDVAMVVNLAIDGKHLFAVG